MAITINVNGASRQVDSEPDTPLLWVLRDELGLTGTKYGCGIAQCGACTVLLDGEATRSCSLPLDAVEGRPIVTIEAVEQDPVGARVTAEWISGQVAQCGYCQSGQIMAATSLLKATPHPTPDDVAAVMTNICRCGTYNAITAAIGRAAAQG